MNKQIIGLVVLKLSPISVGNTEFSGKEPEPSNNGPLSYDIMYKINAANFSFPETFIYYIEIKKNIRSDKIQTKIYL